MKQIFLVISSFFLLPHALPYLKMKERYGRYVETARRQDKIVSEVMADHIVSDRFSRGLKSACSSFQERSEASERVKFHHSSRGKVR